MEQGRGGVLEKILFRGPFGQLLEESLFLRFGQNAQEPGHRKQQSWLFG